MYSKSSWVVQAKARMNIILEVTVEGVKVLFQIHIEERQCPLLVVQCYSYPHWVHCYPQVRTPAVVQELIFMPTVKIKDGNFIFCAQQINPRYIAFSLILTSLILPLCRPLKKQKLNYEPMAGFHGCR